MGFADDLNGFKARVDAKTQAIFVNVVAAAQDSIVNGSPVTGAPGQPVDTGALRASWASVFVSPTEAIIGSNLSYAQPIEEGVGPHGPLALRSSVGGFHSVAHTIAGLDRIVDDETRKMPA